MHKLYHYTFNPLAANNALRDPMKFNFSRRAEHISAAARNVALRNQRVKHIISLLFIILWREFAYHTFWVYNH